MTLAIAQQHGSRSAIDGDRPRLLPHRSGQIRQQSRQLRQPIGCTPRFRPRCAHLCLGHYGSLSIDHHGSGPGGSKVNAHGQLIAPSLIAAPIHTRGS